MRKTLKASILSLVLSCSAYAGEIGYGSPTPPPTTTDAVPASTTNGEIGYGRTEIALILLNSVLPLL